MKNSVCDNPSFEITHTHRHYHLTAIDEDLAEDVTYMTDFAKALTGNCYLKRLHVKRM